MKKIWSAINYREVYNRDGEIVGYWMGSVYYSKAEMDKREEEKK